MTIQFSVNNIIPGTANTQKHERHDKEKEVGSSNQAWRWKWLDNACCEKTAGLIGEIHDHNSGWLMKAYKFSIGDP